MELNLKLKRKHGEISEPKTSKRTKLLSTFLSVEEKFNFEAAIADLIDNSLQASWLDDNELRWIRIDINEDNISIFNNGSSISSHETSVVEWGQSSSEHKFNQQILGDDIDPYLRPIIGKFGYGVAVSSVQLGRCAKIFSKSKAFDKVHTFEIEGDGSSGTHIWKTEGEIPSILEEELRKASQGSFTKVEIFNLHAGRLELHKLLCKLKDIYFPYILAGYIAQPQIDPQPHVYAKFRPIEFQVNGKNLAQIDGGEVSITEFHACNGPHFTLELELSLTPQACGSSDTSGKGNARLRCVYFPITQGEENSDRILKELDANGCGIESFSWVSVRRMGRLLPNAYWARLPFMEPKHRMGDEAHRLKRCYSRVKCFIETNACFIPTPCKTDLLDEDPYTKALKSFGARLPCIEQGIHVRILKEGKMLSLSEMESQYKNWILNMHSDFDEEVDCSMDEECVVVNIDSSRKDLLGINSNAVRVCKKVWRKGKSWQRGQRIKILKGASAKFQKTNTYATVEYILVEYFSGATCDHMGCLLTKNSDMDNIIDIRHSIILPLRAIDSGKVIEVDFSVWNKKKEKQHQDSHEAAPANCSSADLVLHDSPVKGEKLKCTQVPAQGDGAKKNCSAIVNRVHKKSSKLVEDSSEEQRPSYSAAPVKRSFISYWKYKRSHNQVAVRTTPKSCANPSSSGTLPFEDPALNSVKKLGSKQEHLENIHVDSHSKCKNDEDLMICTKARPIMERYRQICTDRRLKRARAAIQHLVEMIRHNSTMSRRSLPMKVSQVISPSEQRRLRDKEENPNQTIVTGMNDDLFILVVQRTISCAREHPNMYGLTPNEVRALVQQIRDEQPIRFETLMDMVEVVCDLLNDIYRGNGHGKNKGNQGGDR
ncbi:hypothetical protein ACET3Z_014622 [Daucus carota]